MRNLSRRDLLRGVAAVACDAVLTGCCRHGMKVMRTGQLIPPPGVSVNSALTVDVHCHIFNGTDLQVERFMGDVTFPHWWGKAAGEILQLANWSHAPTGDEEQGILEQLLLTCQASGSRTSVSRQLESQVEALRSQAYKRARVAVMEVQQKRIVPQAPLGALDLKLFKTTQDAKAQVFDAFASSPDYAQFKQKIRTAPPLTENMKPLLNLQQFPTRAPTPNQEELDFAFSGALNFINQYFQFRFVCAQDYLNTFTPAPRRDVDLLLASLVDYDWWLAGGNPTPTNLQTQIEVMRLISILSDGRVHGFAPFCPLREVAARAGKQNDRGDSATSSLGLVQDAVRNKGCIGVKLYPPMGFALYGNSQLDDPSIGGDAKFWADGGLPDWSSSPITYRDGTTKRLGVRLDEALNDLYTWCEKDQVPILVHTSQTNGTSDKYKHLAAPSFCRAALQQHPKLRLDFGHLGGLDEQLDQEAVPQPVDDFIALLSSSFPNTYADVAYSSGILLDQTGYEKRLLNAFKDASSKGIDIGSRLMYATDWSLLEQVGDNEEYMEQFVQLLASAMDSNDRSRSDLFFGRNAASYIGLWQTMDISARSRLEQSYAASCIPKPRWARKVDSLATHIR